jgi:hypothetical protein
MDTKKIDLQFYPHVANITHIHFTAAEQNLLNKGLQYNIHHKPNMWLCNLAWETKATVTQLPHHDQDHIRHRIADTIRKLSKKHYEVQSTHNTQHYQEKALLRQIKQNLDIHQAMITKADKGNTIIIIYQQDYNSKIQTFINNNSFSILCNDPMKKFQCDLRKDINLCTTVIPQNMR